MNDSITLGSACEILSKETLLASSDDLLQIFMELHPAESLPDVSGAKAVELAVKLAAQIRQGLEPEEIIDLWNVVFSDEPSVYYDEEDEVLRPRELE